MQARTGKPTDAEPYFRQLVTRARQAPDAQRELARAAAGHPTYLLAFAEEANPEVLAALLPGLMAENAAALETLPTRERERLLANWYRRGSREELARFLEAHPTWEAAAWPVQLRQLVDGGRFEQAVLRAAKHYKVSLDLPATPDGRRPDSPAVTSEGPAAEFLNAWREGNTVTARRVLDEAAKVSGPVTDPEVLRFKAALSAHDADWPAAWQSLDRYLRQIGPGEYLL